MPTPSSAPSAAAALPIPVRLHWLLHGATAGVLAAAAFVPGRLRGLDLFWPAVQPAILSAGLLVLALGCLPRLPGLRRLSARLCLALLALVVALAAIEGLGRLAGLDWSRSEARLRRVPPFYRLPTVPIGDGLLRRPGPEAWTGQPIRACLDAMGLPSADFSGEPVITVRYDAQGFRNDPPLARWRVAVTGDSFTELGQLPAAALFTTRLGRALGVAVRNLGVSHTGPLTQLAYLERYSASPDTTDLVLVFAEANDLEDLGRELLARARRDRPPALNPGQAGGHSLLEFLCRRFLGPELPPAPVGPPIEAWFLAAAGWVPVSLASAPPSGAQVAPDRQRALFRVFERYADLARTRRVRPWLAFMPCKERVLHGRLRFVPGTASLLANWQPTDLPAWVESLCVRTDIRFVDLTPALAAETRTQLALLYEGLYDTHLNAAGAAVVARTLADALRRKSH